MASEGSLLIRTLEESKHLQSPSAQVHPPWSKLLFLITEEIAEQSQGKVKLKVTAMSQQVPPRNPGSVMVATPSHNTQPRDSSEQITFPRRIDFRSVLFLFKAPK